MRVGDKGTIKFKFIKKLKYLLYEMLFCLQKEELTKIYLFNVKTYNEENKKMIEKK